MALRMTRFLRHDPGLTRAHQSSFELRAGPTSTNGLTLILIIVLDPYDALKGFRRMKRGSSMSAEQSVNKGGARECLRGKED